MATNLQPTSISTDTTGKALVVRSTGSWYIVRPFQEPGSEYQAKIKGNLRLKGFRCTNPVAVGDTVTIQLTPDGTAFITAIEPRRNYIIRRASNLSKEFQIIAANLDQAVLVASLANPVTNTTFIDRFLATAMAYDVPALLVLNKTDLLTDNDDIDLLNAVITLYRTIGYTVVATSTITGQGINDLQHLLNGKTSLLSGNSGVGKSSLINALIPDARRRVGHISDTHHTGTHTTTFSEMLDLPCDGHIIDTPGIKGFGTIDFERTKVAHYFPEIFAAAKGCRFGNCTHTHEPGCAVLQHVNNHLISQSRYNSYLSILNEDAQEKYRKPF